jgi:hypothetical protein
MTTSLGALFCDTGVAWVTFKCLSQYFVSGFNVYRIFYMHYLLKISRNERLVTLDP